MTEQNVGKKLYLYDTLRNLFFGNQKKLKGLQYGFGELYWRTKPRGVRKDFFIFLKTPIKLIKFNF